MHPGIATSLTLAVLTGSLSAQAPADGFRLFGPYLGGDTLLVDNTGATVHTWTSAFTPALGVYLDTDGTLVRPILTMLGVPVGGGGGIQRVALDNTVLWDYRETRPGVIPHHDIALMPNGNVLMVAWEDKAPAAAIAAGRNPALLGAPVFRPDHILEVSPTGPTSGTVVWEWHAFDHLIQDFDPAQANFGVVAAHPELIDVNYPPLATPDGDWTHVNSIDYDPVHDWIMLSAPAMNEIWIIDHGTTTAEAAGHSGGTRGKGGDLLYRWGNPAVYRAGGAPEQQLYFQHNARFVPEGLPGAGQVTVFNNRRPSGSSVVELVLPLDASGNFVLGPGGRYGPTAPTWSYSAPGFGSQIMSSAERLPNGNTLVCSSSQRRVFEISPSGQTVWDYTFAGPGEFPFHAHYVERALWTDRPELSLATGGTATFDVIAGSAHAASAYLLLGSATGTSPGVAIQGQVLPLNPDSYFFGTLANPNTFPLANSLGTLDSRGRASASFTLPGGILPAALLGLRLDHACVVVDPTTVAVTRTTNAVPLTFAR